MFSPNYYFNVHVGKPKGRTPLNKPSPTVNHFIGSIQDPVTTSFRDTLYISHHPEHCPVERLTFLHVGGKESVKVSNFSKSCKSIEFCGHIDSADALFGIAKQLRNLKNLTIYIGASQQHYFADEFWKARTFPTVETLKICVSKNYFYSFKEFQHSNCDNSDGWCAANKCLSSRQYSLVELAQSLLLHAVDSFPNLKQLDLKLPENEVISDAIESLLESMTQTNDHEVPNGAEENKVCVNIQTFPVASNQEEEADAEGSWSYDDYYSHEIRADYPTESPPAGCSPMDESGGDADVDVPEQNSPQPELMVE